MIILRGLALVVGVVIVYVTLASAIKTFVLPRAAPDKLTRSVFLSVRFILHFLLKSAKTYAQRDRILAYYAPIGLLLLLPVWYTLVFLGYSCVYWAVGAESWYISHCVIPVLHY